MGGVIRRNGECYLLSPAWCNLRLASLAILCHVQISGFAISKTYMYRNRQYLTVHGSNIVIKNAIANEIIIFQCPDSASKNDLEAYRQRITLYCHQLNITSKVKADVQNISGALIVSGVSLAQYVIC